MWYNISINEVSIVFTNGDFCLFKVTFKASSSELRKSKEKLKAQTYFFETLGKSAHLIFLIPQKMRAEVFSTRFDGAECALGKTLRTKRYLDQLLQESS